MVNKVIIVGRLGSAVKVISSIDDNGKGGMVSFSVATSENWKDKNGERQEKTEWHDVVAFNKLAEICARFLKKGQLVYIEGKIQSREWEDDNGNKRQSKEIIARDMKMLGSKGDKPQEDDNEDIPF